MRWVGWGRGGVPWYSTAVSCVLATATAAWWSDAHYSQVLSLLLLFVVAVLTILQMQNPP